MTHPSHCSDELIANMRGADVIEAQYPDGQVVVVKGRHHYERVVGTGMTEVLRVCTIKVTNDYQVAVLHVLAADTENETDNVRHIVH